jgi:dihydrofolate reductase
VDEMHFVISPALIGSGERLFPELNLPALGYQLTDHIPTAGATHVLLSKRLAS